LMGYVRRRDRGTEEAAGGENYRKWDAYSATKCNFRSEEERIISYMSRIVVNLQTVNP
jgi:hypothetical protein